MTLKTSLKVIQTGTESLGAFFCSPFIVNVAVYLAVYKIFSVKE